MRRWMTGCVVLAGLSLVCPALVGAPSSAAAAGERGAAAGAAEHGGIVADVPGSNTPHVVDGQVRSIAEVGDTVVMGGEFTQVSSPDGEVVYERQNLVANGSTSGVAG